MVKESCLKIWPAIPITNANGRNTATVVKVEPVIAPVISRAPSAQAWANPFFICRCRKIFSITTIALSTNMPTPKARPPKDIILRLILPKYIRQKVAIIEMGIDTMITAEERSSRRKNSRTKKASMPP